MNQRILALAACIWLGVPTGHSPAATLATEEVPPEFEAIYEVRKGNIIVGEMTLSLRKHEDTLVYESRTYPVGIAAFFLGSQVATYRTVLEKTQGTYRTIQFRYEVQGNDKDRNEMYSFDWNTHRVYSRYKGRIATLEIAPHTFDRLSAQLLLMRKPQDGVHQYTCSVVTRGDVKEFVFQLESAQPIETRLGTFSAYKYVREKNDGKNTRYTEWYAESLNYIPVRSDKVSNGKTEISARITEVRWL